MSDEQLGAIMRRLALIERELRRPRAEAIDSAVGVFTPGLAGSGTPGTFTYDTANTEAVYTRLRNEIFIEGRVIVTATSVAPTGNVAITGLPFTSAGAVLSGNIAGGFVIVWSGINLQAGYGYVAGVVTGSATDITLYECGDNVARVNVQGVEMAAAWDLFFVGRYRVP